MRPLARRKDGNAFADSITWIGALFVLAIGIVIIGIIIVSFKDAMLADDDIPVEVQDFNEDTTELYVSALDHVFFLFLVVAWGAAIVLSLDIATSSVWMWITFALSIFVFLFAAAIAGAYSDFATAEGVAQFAALFPKMAFVMNNLVKAVVAFFVTIMVALYAKDAG